MLSAIRPRTTQCMRSLCLIPTQSYTTYNYNTQKQTTHIQYNTTHTTQCRYMSGGHHGPARNGSFMYRHDVEDKVLKIFSNVDKIPKDKLSIDSKFSDLNLNDLDQMELLVAVENEFVVDLEDNEAAEIKTVKQLVDILTNHPFAQ